ncbi:hypothetical protein PIB30_082281 [Stylosanthes scabra]|uniref:Uncharacterized protein n=1 Tax=Stylosanthes scabra TaxID=79078 RepID=A0ABU6QUC5_9FABA|nr:hypothetical protein [Stylosanthes scabra]
MGVIVDGRRRLMMNNDKKKKESMMMNSYFGNVLSIPFGGKPINDLMEKPLSELVEEVREIVEAAATEEHFLGLVDWVEALRPVPALTRIYCETGEGPCLVVSSGQRFPESKVDFGWGKPVFASYHFPWGGDCGYVMPMPSPKGNGDWILYMHLHKGLMEFMESHFSHVFRPLSWDYLLY